MKKYELLLIGTHNDGKFREISKLISKKIKKSHQKLLKLRLPKKQAKLLDQIQNLRLIFFIKNQKLYLYQMTQG